MSLVVMENIFFPWNYLKQAEDFDCLLHGMASPIIRWSLVISCAVNGPASPLTVFTFLPP